VLGLLFGFRCGIPFFSTLGLPGIAQAKSFWRQCFAMTLCAKETEFDDLPIVFWGSNQPSSFPGQKYIVPLLFVHRVTFPLR
jgi:hypothetical protein